VRARNGAGSQEHDGEVGVSPAPAPADLLLIAALVAPILVHLPDYDSWWHLKAGERWIEQGRPRPRDAFSFTAANRAWFAHEWIPELGLAWVWRTSASTRCSS